MKKYRVLKNFTDLQNNPHIVGSELEISDDVAQKLTAFVMPLSEWQDAQAKKSGMSGSVDAKTKTDELLMQAQEQVTEKLAFAQAESKKMLEEAKAESDTILEEAEANADEASKLKAEATKTLADAKVEAEKILTEAKTKAKGKGK